MNKIVLHVILAMFLWSLSACGGQQKEADYRSQEINFNADWQFRRSNVEAGMTEWEMVSLPHTAHIEPTVVNDQWQGDAYYKKAITAPMSWQDKRIIVRFEGAMNKSVVSLNGVELLTHQGGYLPVVVDLSDNLVYGESNLLEVHLDNRDNPITGPKPREILDFTMYSGLYRGATLKILNPVHISDEILANKVAGGGLFVTYPSVANDLAKVNVQAHIENTSEKPVKALVQHALYFGNEKLVEVQGTEVTIGAGNSYEDTTIFDVASPNLWSPQKPNLHRLETRLVVNGEITDHRSTRIGIRSFEIKKEGFWINGEKQFLRGVNRHQEYPYVGYALSENADYRDAVKIKEAGFDYVRLSHYPHSPAFMAAADELGLVLLDAILGWQYFNEDPAFTDYVVQACRDLIRRDRNHASVIAWECSLNETAMPDSLVQTFHKTVHEEFPGKQAYSAGWLPQEYDIYLQARQHRQKHYEYPEKPYNVSEYGDWEYYAQNAGLNQDAWAGLKEEERTSRQLLSAGEARLLQQATNIQESHNDNFNTSAFADGYWAMFDYNRGYADDIEASGIMSLHRLPKYSYYFFKSQRDASEISDLYQSGAMAFIASEWTEASSTNVRVFSNADEVELFLNGRSVGKQRPDQNRISNNLNHPPFSFDLPSFETGTLNAVAYIAGKMVAEHGVSTPEEPKKLSLRIDTSGKAPKAGVNDLTFVYASIVDDKGTVVPVNGASLSVSVAGDATIVNPDAIVTSAGIAAILLRLGDQAGEIIITASVQGQDFERGLITFRQD